MCRWELRRTAAITGTKWFFSSEAAMVLLWLVTSTRCESRWVLKLNRRWMVLRQKTQPCLGNKRSFAGGIGIVVVEEVQKRGGGGGDRGRRLVRGQRLSVGQLRRAPPGNNHRKGAKHLRVTTNGLSGFSLHEPPRWLKSSKAQCCLRTFYMTTFARRILSGHGMCTKATETKKMANSLSLRSPRG